MGTARLRVFLCGQRAFGAAAGRLLRDRPDVELVGISAPLFSRHGDADSLWDFAQRFEVPWIPAGALRAENLPAGVDLIVAAHSHDYLGRRTRAKARLGAIGYHPSLLPLHRGRDAVRWTIRDKDRIAGGTVYWFTDGVDCGPVAAQDWCFVRPGDTAETLWRRELFPMGLRLLAQVLDDLAAGTIVRIPQDNRLATWEPALDAPPLFRPELPALGNGGWEGYRVVVERG